MSKFEQALQEATENFRNQVVSNSTSDYNYKDGLLAYLVASGFHYNAAHSWVWHIPKL